MSKNLGGFNPDVNEFIDKKKDLTVIGLYWAGYWRLAVAIFVGYIAFMLSAFTVAAVLGALFA